MQECLPSPLPLADNLAYACEELSTIVQRLGCLASRKGLPADLSRNIEMVATDAEAVGRDARERAVFMSNLTGMTG